MIFLSLLLAFSRQAISCDSSIPQRSITFRGQLSGDDLTVTRGGRDFDARMSLWSINVFDAEEQSLNDFYLERAAERDIGWLAGAIYMPPNEYDEAIQPELSVYVWLPTSAFNSLWVNVNISSELVYSLTLTAPFQGSALNYVGGGKEWSAQKENPLLLTQVEFNMYRAKNA